MPRRVSAAASGPGIRAVAWIVEPGPGVHSSFRQRFSAKIVRKTGSWRPWPLPAALPLVAANQRIAEIGSRQRQARGPHIPSFFRPRPSPSRVNPRPPSSLSARRGNRPSAAAPRRAPAPPRGDVERAQPRAASAPHPRVGRGVDLVRHAGALAPKEQHVAWAKRKSHTPWRRRVVRSTSRCRDPRRAASKPRQANGGNHRVGDIVHAGPPERAVGKVEARRARSCARGRRGRRRAAGCSRHSAGCRAGRAPARPVARWARGRALSRPRSR